MTDLSSSDAPFRFHHPVPVRFRDIDVGGHAHHSLVLMYVEEARWRYWEEVAGRAGVESVDYIMAEVTIRYRARILYPDTLDVGVRVTSVGRKHFEMEYEIRSGAGALLATARSTQVMYDYEAGRSIPVPDELREKLDAWEGGALPRRREG